MKIKKQRLLSLLLAIIFFTIPFVNLIISSKNLIYAEEIAKKNTTFIKKIPIEIKDKIFEIEVKSNLPFEKSYNYSDKLFKSLNPEYEVGTTRYFTFNITREALGLTSGASEVSIRMLSNVTNKLLAKAIPGIGWLSLAAIVGAGTMYVCGVNGLEVSIELEYVEHYYNMGGYYIYAWELNSVDVTAY